MNAITRQDACASHTPPGLASLLSHFCLDQQQPGTFELMALQSYFDNIAFQEQDPASRKRKAALQLSEALEKTLLHLAGFDNDFLDNYLSVKHAEREIMVRYLLPRQN